MRKLVFVCAGNVGRSPLAAILARHRIAGALGVGIDELEGLGVEITSRGTTAPSGIPVSPRSVAVAAEHGLDLSGHESHHLDPADVSDADLVLCMDRRNMEAVLAVAPNAPATLLDPAGADIPDPRYRDLEFHREVGAAIDRAILLRLDDLIAGMQRPEPA